MTDGVKLTFKNQFIYFLGIVASKIVGFVMLPIYTRFLSPSDYGTLEILMMTLDVIEIFVGMGLGTVLFRFYFKYDNERDRNEVVTTFFSLIIFTKCIGFIFILSSAEFLSQIILKIPEGASYFKIVALTFLLDAGVVVPLGLLRAKQEPLKFVIVSLIKLFLHLSFNIYFVIFLKMKVLGILYSDLIATTIMALFLFLFTFNQVRFVFVWQKAREMIAYGYPLVFAYLSSFILTYSDRYFLRFFCDLKTVGIYALGYKLGWLVALVITEPFVYSWDTIKFQLVKKIEGRAEVSRINFYYNLLLAIFALSVSLYAADFFRIMSAKEFWTAYKIVPLIAYAYVIDSWITFSNLGLEVKKKTKLMALSVTIGAIMILILNYLLIPWLGGIGAALATVLAFLVKFCIVTYFSKKTYSLFCGWQKIFNLHLYTIIFIAFSLYLKHDIILISLSIKTLLLIIYLGVLFFSPLIKENDRKMLLNKIYRRDMIALIQGKE